MSSGRPGGMSLFAPRRHPAAPAASSSAGAVPRGASRTASTQPHAATRRVTPRAATPTGGTSSSAQPAPFARASSSFARNSAQARPTLQRSTRTAIGGGAAEWGGVNLPCPHCGVLASRSHQVRCVKRSVACPDCHAAVSAASIGAHRISCPSALTDCPGCRHSCPRQHLRAHITVNCRATTWRCGECGELFHAADAYASHAIPSCTRRVVACQLCARPVPFSELAAHLATCADQQIRNQRANQQRVVANGHGTAARKRLQLAQAGRGPHAAAAADDGVEPWGESPDRADPGSPSPTAEDDMGAPRASGATPTRAERSATASLLRASPRSVAFRDAGASPPTGNRLASTSPARTPQRMVRAASLSPAPSHRGATSPPTSAAESSFKRSPTAGPVGASTPGTASRRSVSAGASARHSRLVSASPSAASRAGTATTAVSRTTSITAPPSIASSMRARARDPIHSAWKALVARHERPPQPDDIIEAATGRRVGELTRAEQRLLLEDWRRARMSRSARAQEDQLRAAEHAAVRSNANVVRAITFSDPLVPIPTRQPVDES